MQGLAAVREGEGTGRGRKECLPRKSPGGLFEFLVGIPTLQTGIQNLFNIHDSCHKVLSLHKIALKNWMYFLQ